MFSLAAAEARHPQQPAQTLTVSAASRSQRPGELVVLNIEAPATTANVRAVAFNRPVAVYPLAAGHWQALVGIDLDVAPGDYDVKITADGSDAATYHLVVGPRQFPTRRLTVDEAFVNPPASEQERIERDSKLLERTWANSAHERLWSGPFVRPVPGEANSRFGSRSIFNGVPRNPHGGADFLSGAGTPIHAPNAGRIAIARDLYFSGNTVVIDHGLGIFSLLAHLSEFAVHEGDQVQAGQVVGKVGATGRVTGPHLHWALRANGARVDPLSALALLGRKPA
jgi:murein DD-endopeptidase MepM/ murein hydrolase activator NlpD